MAQRIPDWALHTTAFLYPTDAEAKAGAPTGASAFFVGLPWESNPKTPHIYAVTNRHVIEPDKGRSALVLRLNLKGGGTDTIPTNNDEWRFVPSNDLAVRYCHIDHKFEMRFDAVETIITDEIVTNYQLGIGDEVFSIGRFIDTDDATGNKPIVRFGQVAAMPAVPVVVEKGVSQDSYLVEMRSRTGFSGSPVYIFVDPSSAGNWVHRKAAEHTTTHLMLKSPKLCGPWILGVHWGQLPTTGPDAFELGAQRPQHYGTGITGVVPGQTLRQFILEDEELKRTRKAIEDEWNAQPHASLETAESTEPAHDNPSHKEDFMSLLGAAARSNKPAS